MTLKSDQGCGTPKDATKKQIHQRLVQLFAPLVYFEPDERFFPVDLPSTIKKSSLWLADPTADPPSTQSKKKVGAIDPLVDLPAAATNHYTTVAGTGSILKKVEGKDPFNMPVPLLKQVYDKYTSGEIAAELTVYATVCSAHDVPNTSLVSGCAGPEKEVKNGMSEGLIINYYLYFPACESPEFESEGDWSGISLLLGATPTTLAQLGSAAQLQPYLPVLAFYYHKTTSSAPPSPAFVTGDQGIRRWKDVKRGHETAVGDDTHPVVYVSRGRHNCYYEPATTTVKLSPPWQSTFTPDKIEGGEYAAGPAANTLQGGGDWESIPDWAYALFPPLAALVACGSGCEYPWHFDSSGLPTGFSEGEELTKDGGYNGFPGSQGSSYPKTSAANAPAASLPIKLKLVYVDLDNATTAALWGYAGAWGAATAFKATSSWDTSSTAQWGYYRGARRPTLAAWLVWNLFLDKTYGCRGWPELTYTRYPF
jgi:hypothetical protein